MPKLRYKNKAELYAAFEEQVRALEAADNLVATAPKNMAAFAHMKRESEIQGFRRWLEVHAILLSVLPED